MFFILFLVHNDRKICEYILFWSFTVCGINDIFNQNPGVTPKLTFIILETKTQNYRNNASKLKYCFVQNYEHGLTFSNWFCSRNKYSNLCNVTWKITFGNIFLQEFLPFNVLKKVPYTNRDTTKTGLFFLVHILIPKY